MTVEPYWTVAVSMSQREDIVQQHLKRDGFETYLPKIRTDHQRTGPLFPGYLMVRVVVRWYPIRWCPGVLRLLMDGDRPARLADTVIREIRGREVRGLVKLPKNPNALQAGQKVRVTAGNFTGHVAVYQGMNGPQRERILLDLLGQSVPVILPVGSLEAVRTLA